jgi:hypothetical protein
MSTAEAKTAMAVVRTAVITDALLRVARDPSIDIAKMRWLLDTRTKINSRNCL